MFKIVARLRKNCPQETKAHFLENGFSLFQWGMISKKIVEGEDANFTEESFLDFVANRETIDEDFIKWITDNSDEIFYWEIEKTS